MARLAKIKMNKKVEAAILSQKVCLSTKAIVYCLMKYNIISRHVHLTLAALVLSPDPTLS